MRVIKVLNTSVVLALDDSGMEVVLMGKGIGFHKSIGNILNDSDVEKVFILKDRSIAKNIIRLSAEIDADIFEIVKEAIDYAQERISIAFHPLIHIQHTWQKFGGPAGYGKHLRDMGRLTSVSRPLCVQNSNQHDFTSR